MNHKPAIFLGSRGAQQDLVLLARGNEYDKRNGEDKSYRDDIDHIACNGVVSNDLEYSLEMAFVSRLSSSSMP